MYNILHFWNDVWVKIPAKTCNKTHQARLLIPAMKIKFRATRILLICSALTIKCWNVLCHKVDLFF